jgi:hypothetical protein
MSPSVAHDQDQSATVVTFRLTGEALRPEVITELLGVTPSKAWSKGDVRMRTSTGTFLYSFGSWSLQAACSKNEPFEIQLNTLLDQLESLPSELYELTKAFNSEISVAFSSSKSTFGFHITYQTIERLNTLGLAIDFDIYTIDDVVKMEYTNSPEDPF